jgi:hypothetical protein
MRKSTLNVLFGIVFIALAVSAIAYFSGFNPFVTSGTCRETDSGTKDGTFTCPGTVENSCQVSGIGVCSDKNPASYVNFRTNDLSFQSGWISVDTNSDGQMEGYSFTDYQSSRTCTYHPGSGNSRIAWTAITNNVFNGWTLARWNNVGCTDTGWNAGSIVLVRETASNRYDLSLYQTNSPNALVTSVPLSEYIGKEGYSQYLYHCKSELKKTDGTILETVEYAGNTPNGAMSTKTYSIKGLTGVTFGNYKISYISYDCGICGDCDPNKPVTCTSATTYDKCISNIDGCGVKSTQLVDNDFICNLDSLKRCDDSDTCTSDTRTSAQSSCAFTKIVDCCHTASECNDGNACTSDSCSGSVCKNTAISTCCNPQCNTNQYCDNQVCKLLKGCKYDNPLCVSPQLCDKTLNQALDIFGKCACPTTSEYCQTSEIGNEKCQDNKIYLCQSSGLCATWQVKQTCGEQEICI